ncbi:MAG: efflux RND transporter periplasmic adaptor subunit [Xanthomonadales bacterium]|nr:efflux RND transporter periplasmic adaptor subunit [Xanthomonadales bacterium]
MKKIIIFGGLALLLVGLPLISKLTDTREAKQVNITSVELKSLKSSILASGTLTFREQVQLRSEVIGQVIELHVEEADQVSKGQLVITLDPKNYQAQVDQAQARVRISAIAIERQRLLISNLAERFERRKSLYKSKLVGEDSYQALESELSLSRVDLRSLQESLLQARAALDQSEDLLRKTLIKSPIDGIVIQSEIKVGETVIAGTTNIPGSTLMVIADPSATLTEVQVDEADIAQIIEGLAADIYSAAYPDTPLSGVVESIATVARRAPGQQSLSFLVKILLDEQDSLIIRPGMSVRADIYTQTSEETISVPIQAVLFEEGTVTDKKDEEKEDQAYVFLFQKGKAVRKNVEVGLSSDSDQEITKGLRKGQRIVIGPYRTLVNLRDEEEIEIIETTDDKDAEDTDASFTDDNDSEQSDNSSANDSEAEVEQVAELEDTVDETELDLDY